MKIPFAHLHEQGIDFAVFAADSTHKSQEARQQLLHHLTQRARNSGLKIDKSALQYPQGSSICFLGTPDLVSFLESVGGIHHWTHEVTI